MDDVTEDDEQTPWGRTIEQVNAMADELEADGWRTVTVRAAHVTPEPPRAGDSDRFGLVYVAPGNIEDTFREVFEAGEFTEYEVFRQTFGHGVFLITKLTDPDRDLAILLAGSFDLSEAGPLVEAAMEAGEMYSHVQLLDWTHLGSFRHDDPELFFPD